jgi:predicted alpha/beta superfamily hydrolase
MATLQFHNFYMPQLDRSRGIRVLLPSNYFKSDQRYPVLYAQDGQNLFDPATAAFRDWGLPKRMDAQSLHRQAIIVGVDNGGIDRLHEYAPFRRGRNGGQGDAYVRFLSDTLKPFIDQNYRTYGHPEATGIVGSSAGGLLAFYAGLRYGHVFGKVGALSPSLWFNPKLLDVARQHQGAKPKMYVAGSKTEMRGMENTLQNTYWALKTGGWGDADIRVVARDRGKHNEVFWGREFKPMFEWFFA